ncbi:MAG: TonB-dependent receptor [Verrucomicrobia bacterium]|nr:TonB-dependent receptor [Verrucomicrobiota bacterium]
MTSPLLRAAGGAFPASSCIRFALPCLLALVLAATAFAQSGAGKIAGRIFNPSTQQYVRNAEVRVTGTDTVAFSGDDGYYELSGVAAGAVSLTVTFTGYEVATATVNVAAGQAVTRDFELRGATYQGPARKEGDVIKLDSFVVSTEREGNAKAIMDQRAALNFKNVVATDNFGEVTSGNVGEFVKYMPGIVIDYTQSDARAARIGGLDPKYVGISIDGMRMANAASGSFSGTSRGFEFEQASINSIESIEISKTLTAGMDADAASGSINMKSKNAFERKGRELVIDATLSGNTYAFTLHKTPGPDDGNHLKMFPGFKANYSESFGGRFGVQLSAMTNVVFTEQENGSTNYDFSNRTRGPVITSLSFRHGPKITRRDAFGANFDYKWSDRLILSLRTSGSHLNDQYINRVINFVASAAQIDPASTLTKVTAQPTANANTRLEESQGHRNRLNDTVTYAPKLVYKLADLTLTGGGGYSRSRTHYVDVNGGFFNNVIARITRMGWSAERDSTIQPGWRMTQTSGRSWSDPASFGRDDANANNIRSREAAGQNQVFVAYFDAKKTLNLGGLPVTLAAGGKVRLTTHDIYDRSRQWTYVGPSTATGPGSQLTAAFPVYQNRGFDPKVGGNMTALNIPYVDNTAMQRLYLANPAWFTEDALTNFRTAFTSPRALKEQVDAGFAEGSTRLGRLRLNLGLRHERTRNTGRVFEILPNAVVTAAGYTANSIPGIVYQYRNGVRQNQYGGYGNWFLSGGAKYEFTRNFVLQLAASQSILRPGYDTVAGLPAIDDINRIVTIPNPQMKPELSNKYFASLQYYLEPAGTIALSTYQLDVKNMGAVNTPTSGSAAGFDDPAYAGYSFQQPTNLSGTRKMKGVDFEYSQQLVFLPGHWRGLSVFGSISRTIADVPLVSVVPKSANGGLRYSNAKFNVQLRATWSAARIDGFGTNVTNWQTERLLADLSAGYKINRTYELTIAGRNINNAFQDYYAGQPGLLRAREILGPIWTFGVRGRF